MKIGIFLAYAPGINLSNQGLGRQLVQFAVGFHERSGETITILCPSWLETNVREILSQGGLSDSAYRIACPPGGIPISFRIQRYLSALLTRVRNRRPSWSFWRLPKVSFVYGPLRKAAVYLLSTRSITGFVLTLVLFLALAIAVAPVVLPLLVIFAALSGVAGIWRRAWRRTKVLAGKLTPVNQMHAFLLNLREANRISLVERAYNQVYRRETSWMVDFANSDDTIDFWFSPTVFWPEFNAIKKASALCFPDMVLSEFPVAFAVDHPHSRAVFSRCQKTIEGGRHFITYSSVTAENGLQRRFGVNRERISVIPHAAIDLSHHISIAGTLDPDQAKRRFAVDLLEGYRNVHWQSHPYLANFSFEDVKYFFYPAQLRPNKNIVNLVKGYELSLRKKHQYAKLILTGDLAANLELSEFIRSRRLQYEILYFHNVPEQVLAALYHLAALVVNPTLYEGGFPFTFAEGLSVGTPSIMSDIPQVRQSIPESWAREILFDPYSPDAIADSMAHGLAQRARLLELEMPIYHNMRQRSWGDVASDHVAVFSQICADAKGTQTSFE